MDENYRGIQARVQKVLVEQASQGKTLGYDELARKAELPFGGRNPILWSLLAGVSRAEHANGRPLLSAIVVNGKGMPGSRFFDLARELGFDVSDETAFWTEQVKLVFSMVVPI